MDPVEQLELTGKLVGYLGCPYMLVQRRWRSTFSACGAQATLYRFEAPYGLRSYCEEDHVCVLSELSIPGLHPNRKGRTD